MEVYQQRVIDEKKELDDKTQKLSEFFDNSLFANLNEPEKDLLEQQYGAMQKYSRILGERIAAF